MDDARKIEILDTVETDAWDELDKHQHAVHFEHRIAALQAIMNCMVIRKYLPHAAEEIAQADSASGRGEH